MFGHRALHSLRRPLQRIGALLCAAAIVCGPSRATWSIVVVNVETGEVGVAVATCLTGDLGKLVPVVVPGQGAAAAQAAGDVTGQVRLLMWDGLLQGLTPQEIFSSIQQQVSGMPGKQMGIASFAGDALTFTGIACGDAHPGVAGQWGPLRYAIQGNVLACDQVVYAAEAALVGTDGDLGQRILAGMQAARDFGGDGRCTCSVLDPTHCGCPPPSFTKSCISAVMVVARIGDELGTCEPVNGCAASDYYCDVNIFGKYINPEPINLLSDRYANWRAYQIGRVDQVHTAVLPSAAALPADGRTEMHIVIRTADIDRTPLAHGGLQLNILPLSTGAPVTTPTAVLDQGDGTYRVTLRAGTQTGSDTWRLTLIQTGRPVVLQPDVTVRVDPPAPLFAGFDEISAGGGASVPFTLDLGPAAAGKSYLLLGSASGTSPGFVFEGELLPLNADGFLRRTFAGANGRTLIDTRGVLDAAGRAQCTFLAPAGSLTHHIGHTLAWAARVTDHQPGVAGPVSVDVLP